MNRAVFVGLLPVLCVYHLLRVLVLAVVPRRRKCVAGNTVLITGAGSGIGQQMARRFAALDANLVLVDVNQTGMEQTERLVQGSVGRVLGKHRVDITDRDAVRALANTLRDEKVQVDILVNNAGIIGGNQLFWESSDEMNIRTMEVNTISHFWTSKEFLPGMVERNSGHLVTISSMAGIMGVAKMADYNCSKFAATGFDEGIRHELAAQGCDGVKTTCVYPMFINTGMFKGVTTAKGALSYLFPLLTQEEAVDEMMRGILTDSETVYLPRANKLIQLVCAWMPYGAHLRHGYLTGAYHSMDTFKGRRDD